MLDDDQGAAETPKPGKLRLAGYDSEETTAEELGVSTRTLKRWRRERRGPPVTYIGRRPVYNQDSKRRWLTSRELKMPREGRTRNAVHSNA
jgi:hypothetical protein